MLLICVNPACRSRPRSKVSGEVGSQSLGWPKSIAHHRRAFYLQDRRLALKARQAHESQASRRSHGLIQAERYGTPVGQARRIMARENRDMRMVEAEKKAAALPPKLTVPMIIFFLPVLFVVILGPAMIQVFDYR